MIIVDLVKSIKEKLEPYFIWLYNISVADIYGYIQGNTLYKLYTYSMLPSHIIYQVENIRMKNCSLCLAQGSCMSCSCTTPAKFFDFRACKEGKYPKMMNRFNLFIYLNKDKIVKNAERESRSL